MFEKFFFPWNSYVKRLNLLKVGSAQLRSIAHLYESTRFAVIYEYEYSRTLNPRSSKNERHRCHKFFYFRILFLFSINL